MLKKYRYFLIGLIQGFLYHLVRCYSWTFRLQIENEKPWLNYLEGGGRVLLCGCHQQFFAAIYHFKTYSTYHPSLMISQSKDGDIIAGIAEKSGWIAVRGSSSRRGGRALREMVDRLENFGLAAHIVDGPKGPAGIIKSGVLSLARSTGAVIVPFYLSSDRALYFHSWDRFMLPKPFASVKLRFGDMLDFSHGESDEAFEEHRLCLQRIMLPSLVC
ncbi:MAG: hypothetical protein A4E72_01950 [Syntrophus sp. PtaU1.Bin208]|nr:MAG: hypothetical protein A4E72_01950 [Syntrophus sp. PtaU1.Bin208]